jgi:hypothetical protein
VILGSSAHCCCVGWELLLKSMNITQEKEVQNMQDIGIDIVRKCGGLPLAIKLIAKVLASKDRKENEWKKILRKDAWSMSNIPSEIKGALYLMLESYVANNFQFCPFILISHNIKKEKTKNSFILIFNKDKKKKGKKGGKQKGISFILIFNKDKRKKWVVTLCCILWSYLYSPEHLRQFSMLCFVIVWEIQFVYFSFS